MNTSYFRSLLYLQQRKQRYFICSDTPIKCNMSGWRTYVYVQVIWVGIYTLYVHTKWRILINHEWWFLKIFFDNSRTPFNMMNWWHYTLRVFFVRYMNIQCRFSVIIAWIFDVISAHIQLMVRPIYLYYSDYLMLVWVRTIGKGILQKW